MLSRCGAVYFRSVLIEVYEQTYKLSFSLHSRLSHGQSAGQRPGPVLTGQRCPCVRVGQGFGGFLGLCEKVFSLTAMPGGGLPPQVEFFFLFIIKCLGYNNVNARPHFVLLKQSNQERRVGWPCYIAGCCRHGKLFVLDLFVVVLMYVWHYIFGKGTK